jgi:Helix-turn-helix domain
MGISPACIVRAAEALSRHPDLSSSARRSQRRGKAAAALNRLKGLPIAARRLGHELLNRSNKEGFCWPSMKRLAESLGYDERTIRRAKAALVAAGLLIVQERGGHQTDVYMLMVNKLVTLGDTISGKITATCDAAKVSITKVLKPVKQWGRGLLQGPAGRTFSPSYPTRYVNIPIKAKGNFASPAGFFKAPGTPQNQQLTDQQLDGRASARFWTALQQFGAHLMAQFISHPNAEALQDEAVKAERFKAKDVPDGLAGLHKLEALMCGASA